MILTATVVGSSGALMPFLKAASALKLILCLPLRSMLGLKDWAQIHPLDSEMTSSEIRNNGSATRSSAFASPA
jgi:hypothetical protein